ncbi:MAG TPA: thioredoxin reductase [Lachnospiraceae bacterium]|nr:thioredoxin reductase [Lachnospiraceae bacterium]
MAKIIVVGCGPAGISAGIYAARAGMDTMIIGGGETSLKKAHKIDNYYGFEKGTTGQELFENGIKQAKSLGIEVIEDEVVGLSFGEKLTVTTINNSYTADGVILATGSSRAVPKIKGIKDFEGKGVSYCAVCDGFFFRGKELAVLGNGEYAVHEAKELLSVAQGVTIVTDGKGMEVDVPEGVKVETAKISEIKGKEKVESIVFEDGAEHPVEGVFVAMGVAGSADLARKVGAETEGNKIIVDNKMATNVPGLYAAGDCVGGLLQISKAVSDGAIAATSAVKFIRG